MSQKITPFLWFDKNAEEAMNFYVAIFKDTEIESIKRYPESGLEGTPMQGMEGQVLTAVFELEGQKFMALDGGPYFKFNPAVSFFVNCATASEVEALYKKLEEDGTVMMPLQKYPFSEMYAWISDKYGMSWQLTVAQSLQKIVPSFMFVGDKFGKCEEAVNFYISIFRNSKVNLIARYEEGEQDQVGKIKYTSFTLESQQFSAMESSLMHKFTANGAISQYVECETQEEVDYYWNKLTEDGDENAQQCGWLQDKYGFSWQIIPTALPRLLNDPDPVKAQKVMQAMLKMKKIVIADLEKAHGE